MDRTHLEGQYTGYNLEFSVRTGLPLLADSGLQNVPEAGAREGLETGAWPGRWWVQWSEGRARVWQVTTPPML